MSQPSRVDLLSAASMRPGDFSPGNPHRLGSAAGAQLVQASMRPGDFSPGNDRNADRITAALATVLQ